MSFRFAAASLLLIAPLAQAHDPLPSADWCQQGRPVQVAEFRFQKPALFSYRACLAKLTGRNDDAPGCTVRDDAEAILRGSAVRSQTIPTHQCPAQTCGEFDDDYNVARRMAFNLCNTFATGLPSLTSTDNGSVVAILTGPSTLIAPGHHADYTLSQGMTGICARCLSAETVKPDR
ncbi:MAG: hypothetical protein BGP24_20200 [Lysobacterales bacterium 69-70]|nr:hypothetical protein [Xanthomonadaceae bacterium]ODU35808.1 MAG: hypothetical protein ABS97_03000 [Xanthomonadaceae bacterium SCN 69-320]ODV17458.1 MAG: hypothetical protein ABT27_17085 [Xanthomonadaceae bacterium SCN 69-25]OJY97294.1 MAG: hypothetical protein BGP24_20200 [Xanthomonadales bacterium 69-70]